MLEHKTTRGLLLALLTLSALLLAACAGAPAPTAAPPSVGPAPTLAPQPTAAPAATSAPAVGQKKIYYVSPDPLGVNEFLLMGKTGLEAVGKKYNAVTKVLESEDPATREQNVRAAISDGADIIIVLGFEFGDIIPKVAAENPNIQFLIIDQCIDKPPANVHCAVFREYEAAYLIGAEAGLLTKTNKVGAISALDIPFMHRYTDGFAAGAKAVNPNVETSTLWVGGDNPFADPARGKEQALAMAAQGNDQIFAAGAASNLGIFEAAKEKNFMTYGVDVNQCPTAPGLVVDNLLKRVDVAIVQSVDAIMNGSKENVAVYGLKEGGIGIIPFADPDPGNSQCEIMKHPEVILKLKELQSQIISGALKLKDPMFP